MNNLAEIKKIETGEVSIESKLQSLKNNSDLVSQMYREILKKDEHYGIIPGTGKPSLLKSGAEKLSMVFRFIPAYEVESKLLDNGHREYTVKCSLVNQNGELIGMGIGICTTMESKYRYRNDRKEEYVGSIPEDYKDRKASYRNQGLFAKKDDTGGWGFYKITTTKKENPDIADVYNTVLKMAKKRAYVDAVITATGCSDMFTQDVEDFVDESHIKPKEDIGHDTKPIDMNKNTQPKVPTEKSETTLPPETVRLENLKKALDTAVENNDSHRIKEKTSKSWDSLVVNKEISEETYQIGYEMIQGAIETINSRHQEEPPKPEPVEQPKASKTPPPPPADFDKNEFITKFTVQLDQAITAGNVDELLGLEVKWNSSKKYIQPALFGRILENIANAKKSMGLEF